jgi:hypothetical protein
MKSFQYQKGQVVRLKSTGETGLVEYCSDDPTTGMNFYKVRFSDGTTKNVAESDLWPA